MLQLRCLVLLLYLLWMVSGVWAKETFVSNAAQHPVSVIEADIYVTKFKTTMRLKCFAEDLELLQGVEALDDGFYDTEELRDATQDHADFLAEKIHLIGADGNKFDAKVIEVNDFEIPEGRVRQGELMKYTIGIVLEYSYEKAPEFLTINQHIISDGLLLPSELKILIKQAGSDDPFFKMMKPDQPETFRFDWTKPAPAADADDQEWSSWFEEQRQKTLGISSYSSVYSFIYITNYQVRHEVLIPLATLNTFFEIQREDPSFLEIAEQDIAAETVKKLFSIGNPVKIDNIEVKPVFDRVDFYALDLRDFAVQAERRKVSMANGRVGIIMSYSTKGIPRDVQVTWDKFNESLKTVDSVVFAFEDVGKAEFSMFLEDNTYRWSSDERKPPTPITEVAIDDKILKKATVDLPTVSIALGCLAAISLLVAPFSSRVNAFVILGILFVAGSLLFSNSGLVTIDHPLDPSVEVADEDAADVFEQLHKNMFRAFDYHSESDIYDALARSVDGDLLQELYLEIIDSLKVAEQGGAISRIESVQLLDGDKLELETSDQPSPAPGFGFRSKWQLTGSVEHWGHIHERIATYDAKFQIELVDRDWKITRMKIEDFQRDAVKTRVRKL